jgi:hypothetical protein
MEHISYESITNILVYFNANAHDPEQLITDLEAMDKHHVDQLQNNMNYLLSKEELGATEFYRATSCSPRNEYAAKQFFKNVYAYAFDNGEEPDIDDYRLW